MAHTHITRSLRKGCRLHAFRSGGGLRVIRIEKGEDGELVGYGEHPHVDDALALANATLFPIIGRMPKRSTYFTGSLSAEGPLDEWILGGRTFDAWAESGGSITVQLLDSSYTDKVPEELLKKALDEGSAEWCHRGGIHLVHSVSYHPHRPEHKYDYGLKEHKQCTQGVYYPVAKTGYGEDFDEALKNALEAPQIEVSRKAVA